MNIHTHVCVYSMKIVGARVLIVIYDYRPVSHTHTHTHTYSHTLALAHTYTHTHDPVPHTLTHW